MIEAINQLIEENGYTKPAEVERRLNVIVSEREHFTHPDVMRRNEWTEEDVAEYRKEQEYQKEIQIIMDKKAPVIHDSGCIYRQATKEMRARYGIEEQAWIIIRETDNQQ